MKRTFLLPLGAVFLFVGAQAFAADEPGFKSLFDGKSLDGWDGDTTFWRVERGAIIGQTTEEKQPADGKNTFLIHRDGEFGDFELRFRYKVEGFNSGVQYRSRDEGGWHVSGMQADFQARWQTDKRNPKKPPFDQFSGMIFDEGRRHIKGRRGDVMILRANKKDPINPKVEKIGSVGDPAELERVIRREDWNEMTIIARGNQYIHLINGRVFCICYDEDESRFRKSGILAFQLHSGRPMKIELKDLRIRELR